MVLDVKYAAKCILLLNSHKWYVDSRYLARVLNMSCEELQEVVAAFKKGGEGARTDGLFKPNPKPYDQKISFSESVDNILNLHESDYGRKGVDVSHSTTSPSDAVLHERCRYYRIGNNRERMMSMAPSLQRDIVKMVVGTHQLLESQYHELARQRKNIWRGWIEGIDNMTLYNEKHLPHTSLFISQLFGTSHFLLV